MSAPAQISAEAAIHNWRDCPYGELLHGLKEDIAAVRKVQNEQGNDISGIKTAVAEIKAKGEANRIWGDWLKWTLGTLAAAAIAIWAKFAS